MPQTSLSIPEPCHEDWTAMTGSEKKRFCSVCTKHVQDFTESPLEDIVSYLSINKGKSVCGVFRQDHLDEMSIGEKIKFFNKKYRKKPVKYLSVILPLLFTAVLHSCTLANSQITGEPIARDSTELLTGDSIVVHRTKGMVSFDPVDSNRVKDCSLEKYSQDSVQLPIIIEMMGEVMMEEDLDSAPARHKK